MKKKIDREIAVDHDIVEPAKIELRQQKQLEVQDGDQQGCNTSQGIETSDAVTTGSRFRTG